MVHGFVAASGAPLLWAETGVVPPPGGRRGRAAVPHPFAAPAAELAAALPGAAPAGPVALDLPTVGAAPLPSPQLGRAAPRRGTLRAAAWTVPAVAPGPGLADLADDLAVAWPEARLGVSAAWLAALAAFAADLVARGRVLPTAAARWRAVLTGADATRHAELLRAQPAAARGAYTAADAQRAALDHLADAAVRARLAAGGDVLAAGHPWVAALAGGPAASAAPRLADALDRWQGDALEPARVRLCLRLSRIEDEEDTDGAGWVLDFHLQPLADPSVVVPAWAVWRDTEATLRHWTHRPSDDLLGGLARAARLYPDLADALTVRRPSELLLDTEGAYRFLTHAPELAQAGHGVFLPAWWRRPLELGLALETRSGAPGAVLRDEYVGRKAAVDFRWRLALGGDPLTEDELVTLARAKTPLVRFRGRWVLLDPDRLAAGLRFLATGAGGRMTAADALRVLRPDEPGVPLPVTAATGTGWVADLLNGRLADTLSLVGPPPSFAGTLRPYQRRGLSWLAFLDSLGVGACLADDMGLGKTAQVLALEAHCRAAGPRPPTLVVCPLSVLGTWQREAARFTPGLRVQVLHGADRALDPAADLVVTTYATAALDATLLAATTWDRIVLDEAQHIKNSAAGVARALRTVPARHRVALTGTPVENRLAELWSILDFVNPGLLGPLSVFRARYAVPIERHADEAAAARLRTLTRPFLLRRTKNDPGIAADLPAKRTRTQFCTLTAEQATLYQAVVNDMLQRLKETSSIARRGLVLSAITKLKQVCNHPAHLLGDGSPLAGRSGKLDRLEEILDAALAAGEPALCFTQYAAFGALLQPHLAARFGAPVRYLHGGVPRGARDALVAGFQADERPGVFLLSLKAGGTGIDLTAARHVVHIDRWWNPATEAQAADRAYRIGQTRDVQVHTLMCLGTVEERIDRLVRDKEHLAERVVGNGEGWLTTLTTAALRDLVRLSPEAVGD
ncbi:DEAD/DEAH box helicase [Spirilliplanes yamanashiensis]|uniref:DEAD/DEAH box helicase n=1 Tax=Spirilliplanes yamanashiensis TaxID=42233 RepID=UPI001EF33FD3|nr:DEAD/DEAH box helicase [Spirilliplanes yamanashiensis]